MITLVDELKQYSSRYKIENTYKENFLTLLGHKRAFHRDHLPGHITGSAWIVDETFNYVLLTHHAKLNKWLQPGGHADGDQNVRSVALREANEETGVSNFTPLLPSIFDLDIHLIPERKDFPVHDHYDMRFLVQANKNEPLIITEESHDLRWVSLNEIASITNNNPSMVRMAEKTQRYVQQNS